MYKLYKGDSSEFYSSHKEFKSSVKLIYLDPPYNSKRNKVVELYY